MRALCLAAFVTPSLTPGATAADAVNVANVSRTLFSLPLGIAIDKAFLKEESLNTTSCILDPGSQTSSF